MAIEIADFPIKNGDFPLRTVSSPESTVSMLDISMFEASSQNKDGGMWGWLHL